MYDLYGPKHHIVEISGDVTDPDEQTTTRKHRATQLLICEKLSLPTMHCTLSLPALHWGLDLMNLFV